MKIRRPSTRNHVFTIPVILTAGLLLVLSGVLAPRTLVTHASTATRTAALHQVDPTPADVPPEDEPDPTEEPTPEPSPTPDNVLHLGSDAATEIPGGSSDDTFDLGADPDNTTGVVFGPSPTPALQEPTPYPEEAESDSEASSVRVVVRWCPLGTELGGPRFSHPLIEKLCTLNGPTIGVNLIPAKEFDKPRHAEVTKPFPSEIEFTPVTPGKWLLQTEFRQDQFVHALFCRVAEPGS